jgi:2-methylcitrate dehydratase PrpD
MKAEIPRQATPPIAPAVEQEAAPRIAEVLADFAINLSYDSIPEAVRIRAKHLMLDATGIALASTRWDFANKTLSALQSLAGAGEIAVIGMPARLPLRDAVLMNGALVHGLDFDDTHVPGILHTTSGAFPCALGVAEQTGKSGRDLLTAYVLGVETGARIATAAKGGFHQNGFHPTGMVAAFSSALIAGRLLGANSEQLAMAQGIVLSFAAGSMEFLEDGAWTKRLHPGWAGAAGVTAATLACHGFVGPRNTYEGRYGLYANYMGSHFDACDFSLVTGGLGDTWEVDRVGVKPYPACHFNHGCVDAALALVHEKGIKAADIETIKVLVPSEVVVDVVCEPVANKRRPISDYDAKFSLQYAVAASIVRGRFGLAELEQDAFSDPEILALADKVEYAIDPQSNFPQAYSGAVVVQTRTGQELSQREAVNRGAADRPLSSEEIVEKFMGNATMAVTPGRAEEIREAVLAMDDFDDVRELAACLGGN